MTITEINAVFAAIDLASNTRAENARFRAKMVDVLYELEFRGLMSHDTIRETTSPEAQK